MKLSKLLTILGMSLLSACSTAKSDVLADRYKAAVMITSLNERSGGSGTVIRSTSSESFILTNKHVCEVASEGGLVHTSSNEKFLVRSYRESEIHDLCVLSIAKDLGIQVPIAAAAPQPMEPAIVIGHPHLLPTTISQGYFGTMQRIKILVGSRACLKDDIKDLATAIRCLLSGEMGVVKSYEALYTSALIMPGSSGSAVYNSRGEISAVIFAGEEGLSYGFAVPFEYLEKFLSSEIESIIPHKLEYKE